MKIGFIAMSGVRPFSNELTALGMTLPGFVERGKVNASLPDDYDLVAISSFSAKILETYELAERYVSRSAAARATKMGVA